MSRFGGVVAAGLAGLLSIKLLIPLLALVFGLFGLAMKIALVLAVGYFVVSLLRNRRSDNC